MVMLHEYCTASTTNDPQTVRMTSKMDRKRSLAANYPPLSTANDPVKSRGMEWILNMNGEIAENLNHT